MRRQTHQENTSRLGRLLASGRLEDVDLAELAELLAEAYPLDDDGADGDDEEDA